MRILTCNLVNFDMQIKVEAKDLLWSRLYEKYFSWSFHTFSVNWLKAPCNLSQDRIAWALLFLSLRAGQNLWIRSLSTRVYWPKIIFGLWRRKKRIGELLSYFWNMCPKPFSWAKSKTTLFPDGKARGPLLAKAALKQPKHCFLSDLSNGGKCTRLKRKWRKK